MPNRLANAASPYLRQHADNPVHWHEWCEEALTLAKREDKPILLSVGYSACHWCHVMAHECFEDAGVAEAMNRHFINIKVDREERPDLDQIYQLAHALLTGRSGGWPLTVFLNPDDHAPFFAGTYFPKSGRYNLPGFLDLLPRIAEAYRTRRQEIRAQNGELLAALSGSLPAGDADADMPRDGAAAAIAQLETSFDPAFGGFGSAPKFPHPAELELCLSRGPGSTGQEMALTTLRRMAEGGIYDQLGGGFCRYSVDAHWSIPHFEKMLYDNGPLLRLYADAWAVTSDPLFRQIAEQTAQWMLREMRAPVGGFYSTLDADSEHEEGKFYVWSASDVQAILPNDEFEVVSAHYGLDGPANFEHRHWHLRVSRPLAAVAGELGIGVEQAQSRLDRARRTLLEHREHRIRPGRDEKILTAWNALAIKGLARAGRLLEQPDLASAAHSAVDFLRRELWRNGHLLAAWKDGAAYLNAYLDDHAFLLDALVETMQAGYRPADLAFAREIADALLARFEDPERGGFFFTSHDHERLIHRPKPGQDNATPSGNGIAALALNRLGHLLGETRYIESAHRALKLFAPMARRYPSAFSTLQLAAEEAHAPPRTVILRGPAPLLPEWTRLLARECGAPGPLALALPNGTADLPASLNHPESGTVNAFVCEGVNCLPAIREPDALRAVFRGPETV